jgi:cytochrome oxidase Cu insertion factor (SCO1/SenC/PrrC family)
MRESAKGHTVLKMIFLLLLVVSPAYSPAIAQLGPKDGAELSATDLNRVKTGQAAPDFTLEDTDGNKITLSDFRGKKTVVLVFYRGYW